MAQGKWHREPITGIPVMQIADCYLNTDGVFDTSKYTDCNLFCVNSISAEAGFTRPDKFKDAVAVGSHFHLYHLTNDEGKITGYATHTNSAQAGGMDYRDAANKRMLTGKRITDVSGGSA